MDRGHVASLPWTTCSNASVPVGCYGAATGRSLSWRVAIDVGGKPPASSLRHLAQNERDAILGENARRFYAL